ncbi:MAG: LytTR family transcriptional regulator [Cyclobacteriaceae bacterium]|nr:LytTR family transcriptional regulator [Cyclobacteriaceae bacterium HetDA_MAG_MS6]
MRRNHLLGSRVLMHSIFWLGYYVLFGLVWAKDGHYRQSFYLEFILLPVRMLAVYSCLYFLIPKFLLNKRYLGFAGGYLLMLLVAGVLQRFFIYFFYDGLGVLEIRELLDPAAVIRAIVLINSTVLLLSAIKVFQLYLTERERNEKNLTEVVEIRSEKRFHRVPPEEITYIEGLGNYVTYHLTRARKMISYSTLREVEKDLPDYFVRIHKSYVVNKHAIKSYDRESVEIGKDQFLPISPKYRELVLFE